MDFLGFLEKGIFLITGLKGTEHNYGLFLEKSCKSCHSIFTPYHPRQKYCCEECQRIAARKQTRKWNVNNPERRQAYQRLHLYNLDGQDYENLLKSQNYKCALCDRTDNLNIDHCHHTGKVRGILCGPCNRALGVLGDSVKSINNVLDYLSFGKP